MTSTLLCVYTLKFSKNYWILCNFFPCSVCFLLQSYLDSTFYFLSKEKIASHFIFKEEYKSTFFRCQCTIYTKFCGSNNSPNAIWKCTSDSNSGMKILLTTTYIDPTQIVKHSYSHPKFTYKKLSDRLQNVSIIVLEKPILVHLYIQIYVDIK